MDSTSTEEITPARKSADQCDSEDNFSETAGFLVVSSIFKGGSGARAFGYQTP